MNRNSQITAAAREVCEPAGDHLGYDLSEYARDISMFRAGARWADSNPAWRPWPEEKPEKSGKYVTVSAKTGLSVGTYDESAGAFDATGVYAWIDLVLPDKDL